MTKENILYIIQIAIFIINVIINVIINIEKEVGKSVIIKNKNKKK